MTKKCLIRRKRGMEVLSKFHACTNLPIALFCKKGRKVDAAGWNEQNGQRTNTYVVEWALESIAKKGMNGYCEFKEQEREYVLLPVHPEIAQEGFYLIGPYQTTTKHDTTLEYKPKDCVNLLVDLLENLERQEASEFSENPQGYGIHVQKALFLLENHYEEEWTLERMVQHLNLSKTYFCFLIKEETGKTFSRLLNEIRIAQSKSLLMERNYSILDVAIAVGYNNQSYFHTAFKKVLGITPKQYRTCHLLVPGVDER